MLEYNVYVEINNNIQIYNIFKSVKFYKCLIEDTNKYKKFKNVAEYKEDVIRSLKYSYNSKAEYEIILAGWPPLINAENVSKLQEEISEHDLKYDWKQKAINVNLLSEKKVSVYDQIMLNFNIFFNYILENIDKII